MTDSRCRTADECQRPKAWSTSSPSAAAIASRFGAREHGPVDLDRLPPGQPAGQRRHVCEFSQLAGRHAIERLLRQSVGPLPGQLEGAKFFGLVECDGSTSIGRPQTAAIDLDCHSSGASTARGRPVTSAGAGPLTAASQTGGTASDSGVLFGLPVDPDLRKRTWPHWPDVL